MSSTIFSGNGYLKLNVRSVRPSYGQDPSVRVEKASIVDLFEKSAGVWQGTFQAKLDPRQGTNQGVELPSQIALPIEMKALPDGSLAGRGVIPNPGAIDACGYQISLSAPDSQGKTSLGVQVSNAAWDGAAIDGGLGHRDPTVTNLPVPRMSLNFVGES